MKAKLFAELMESVHEAAAHARGEISLRTTEMPSPPEPMRSTEVKRVRARLRASQALFAGMLNVSPRLVQAWEAGRREPSGPALVLLHLIKERPELLVPRAGSRRRSRRGREARTL
jgi:putative transcriptional regulator